MLVGTSAVYRGVRKGSSGQEMQSVYRASCGFYLSDVQLQPPAWASQQGDTNDGGITFDFTSAMSSTHAIRLPAKALPCYRNNSDDGYIYRERRDPNQVGSGLSSGEQVICAVDEQGDEPRWMKAGVAERIFAYFTSREEVPAPDRV